MKKVTFKMLNSLSGLKNIDNEFLNFVKNNDVHLYQRLVYSRKSCSLECRNESDLILSLSYLLDDFIAQLFDIDDQNIELKKKNKEFDIIYECKRKFIQRFAIKKYERLSISEIDFLNDSHKLEKLIGKITEKSISLAYLKWKKYPENYPNEIDLLARYCAYMVHNHSSLSLFDIPRKVNPDSDIRDHRITQIKNSAYLGFNYRDFENSFEKAASHAKYCIICHRQKKDTCSHGISKNKTGCPLDQKISEMNLAKNNGFHIGALAIIIIDNPLVPATGHRICNDCMKSCIYQKQDPVNVPVIESNILEQVLSMRWGVEIYLLLTKWNPLNFENPLPKPSTNRNVLITGLGPSGFALSYYLLQEGHNITAIDGLKISPLGFDPNKMIKSWEKIKIDLETRKPQGFGGVAEYGITNRWDKNNLTLIRLVLERRKNFQMFDSVRLGSNIKIRQAFDLGFDHVALCIGSGKPRFLNDELYFKKGIRSAADFLMSIGNGGIYLNNVDSDFQIRLPAIVIGCGLTAIDAAVEILHFYPRFLEKLLADYQKDDKIKLVPNFQEYIHHAKILQKAKTSSEKLQILKQLGGVTICYRKSLKESPAYKSNHEEIEHAMALGVNFEEYLIPKAVNDDKNGFIESISFSNGSNKKARTILLAVGVEPNQYIDIDEMDDINSDLFKRKDKRISYFGDCNPKYSGSVVKALSSVKDGYKKISTILEKKTNKKEPEISNIPLVSYVKNIKRISENITELTIYSPICAINFQPGQFFKLQNYSEDLFNTIGPIALSVNDVDKEDGLIYFKIFKKSISNKIASVINKGEKIALMGPTGTGIELQNNKNIILIGEDICNVGLYPLVKDLIKNNCIINYFAILKDRQNLCFIDKITSLYYSRQYKNNIKLSIYDSQDYKSGLFDLTKKNNQIDLIICSSSEKILSSVKNIFTKYKIIHSINAPMQCMMKGICGKCIVKSDKGYVFACQNLYHKS